MICQLAVRKDRMGRKKTSTEDLTGTCRETLVAGIERSFKIENKNGFNKQGFGSG